MMVIICQLSCEWCLSDKIFANNLLLQYKHACKIDSIKAELESYAMHDIAFFASIRLCCVLPLF